MKSLTKLWFNYKPLKCVKNNCVITKRMFWKKLSDKNESSDSIFVAINTLSGAIDLFNSFEGESIEKCISEDRFENLSDVIFEFLCKRGYIFPSYEVEELVFDTFINDAKNKKYTKDKILGFFTLDTGCPMKCEYCFEKKFQKQDDNFESSVMDKESIVSAFDFLNMMRTIQGKQIDFVSGWGGEPLQKKNFEINKLFLEYACKNDMPVAYFSNLAFIDEKLIDLLQIYKERIKFIQTTLDDMNKNHNSNRKLPNAFEITVNNIDRMLKKDLPVIVRTNIGANNIDDIPELAKFYKSKGWFDYPKFKAYLTHTYDRHHEFKKEFTLTENNAYSKYLEFRDKYPIARKIQGIKFGPSLRNIIEAFKIRECLDVTKNDFEISIKPTITYCFTSNRTEYVFTGKPNYSLYCCAECTGLCKFKLGSYYPKFHIDTKQSAMWGMKKHTIHNVRSIDSIDKCRNCRAATYCGGYCALETINSIGNADGAYCKKADEIIENFLKDESSRLYKRAKLLLDNTENITL